MPLTALGLTLAGLSLVGVPGTAGFITKWYLVVGALERGWWRVVAAVVASSLIAVAYVWRVVEAAYLREPAAAARAEAPPAMLAAGLAMVALCVYFGFETGFSVGGAADAASFLLRGLR
jgi:multicomponent Na+:H+ antiporter subunit D